MELKSKICTKCNINKPISSYNKVSRTRDGYDFRCRDCVNEYRRNHSKSMRGLASNMYDNQVRRSKDRGHKCPSYSSKDFVDFVVSQHKFKYLYEIWVKSGYLKDLVPSVDRIDNSKGYSFDNIRITSWKINNRNGWDESKKEVLKLTPDGYVEYLSVREAAIANGICETAISKACNGKLKTAAGHKWIFKKDFKLK